MFDKSNLKEFISMQNWDENLVLKEFIRMQKDEIFKLKSESESLFRVISLFANANMNTEQSNLSNTIVRETILF